MRIVAHFDAKAAELNVEAKDHDELAAKYAMIVQLLQEIDAVFAEAMDRGDTRWQRWRR